MHVPRPPNNSKTDTERKQSSRTRHGTNRQRAQDRQRDAKDKQDALLSAYVVDPLTKQGLLSGTLTSCPQKWRGYVRIPQDAEGRQEDNVFDRLDALRERRGIFIRMDIQ